MNQLPRITVVTPSYNQAQYIEHTIESVLSQDYPDLEYWVIDGGSTDGTVDILRNYDGRINWISERDRGQTHAINKGLERSTGQVVAYLNSDDMYEPGALRKVAERARHPDVQRLGYLLDLLALPVLTKPLKILVKSWKKRSVLLRPELDAGNMEPDPKWHVIPNEEVRPEA